MAPPENAVTYIELLNGKERSFIGSDLNRLSVPIVREVVNAIQNNRICSETHVLVHEIVSAAKKASKEASRSQLDESSTVSYVSRSIDQAVIALMTCLASGNAKGRMRLRL